MLFNTLGDKSNPAVIFFHAMGVTGASSEPVAKYLQDRYYCILPTSTVYCAGQKYVSKDYQRCKNSDAAIILMLGSGGKSALTKGVAKWFVKLGVNVLSLGPDDGVVGYHSFPLERVEEAIQKLKEQGIRKIGVLGASITSIPALTAASRFSDITLSIVVTPCDYMLQGFTQGNRDGCREWPVDGESMLTYKGEPLPYVNYTYQHPDYWHIVKQETKGSGNMLVAHKIFEDTEKKTPLTEDVMIPVENIKGRLLMIGSDDDCLWPTGKYIRRMDERLKSRKHACKYEAFVYPHGTHYAFPESMLKMIIPIFPDFLIGRAFRAARDYPKECRATREDVDAKMRFAVQKWLES